MHVFELYFINSFICYILPVVSLIYTYHFVYFLISYPSEVGQSWMTECMKLIFVYTESQKLVLSTWNLATWWYVSSFTFCLRMGWLREVECKITWQYYGGKGDMFLTCCFQSGIKCDISCKHVKASKIFVIHSWFWKTLQLPHFVKLCHKFFHTASFSSLYVNFLKRVVNFYYPSFPSFTKLLWLKHCDWWVPDVWFYMTVLRNTTWMQERYFNTG